MVASSGAAPAKLVLCVIDALAPAALEQALAEGQAPALAAIIERGCYVPDCVAAFPSVTPVCAASIVTGAGQDRHRIPGMNWYHRDEQRYIEYGSSFRAVQRFGIARQLTDTVYNMNRAHLAAEALTIFEQLDDADVRTAGTTYLMYRGRHLHKPQRDTALTRIASVLMRHSALGPRELFYADVFSSRPTGCRSALGMPGVRDRHSGCVSAYLVEHDLFDFLLLSLPDNDWYSHKHGPGAQVRSIALADAQLARVMDAGGGVERFLDEHAVIVMADHSQTPVRDTIALSDAFADFDVLQPGDVPDPERLALAVCPSQRAAMVYVLGYEHENQRVLRARECARVRTRAQLLEGVDLAIWMERDEQDAPRAVIASASRGELRFLPGPDVLDARGLGWQLEGELETIGASVRDGLLATPDYPDALARVWAALTCPTSGELLLSAAPGYEFLDWGGQAHVGGGSHGSLHASDSLGALVMCGLDGDGGGGRASGRVAGGAGSADVGDAPAQWAIRDIAPLIARHFGLGAP